MPKRVTFLQTHSPELKGMKATALCREAVWNEKSPRGKLRSVYWKAKRRRTGGRRGGSKYRVDWSAAEGDIEER